MKINIPCSSCGCQTCDAKNKSGDDVIIQICSCNDGSGNYDIEITPKHGGVSIYETHRCPSQEIEICLSNRFDIDIDSINHECSN